MRYLVTGGAGFIGSHLTESLLGDNHEVSVLDDFSTGRAENIAHLTPCGRLEVIRASVTEAKIVDRCVQRADAVFHLASAVGVQLIIDEPVKTIETIVDGAQVVLEACARGDRPVLITSTSEVYGKSTEVPFSEDDDSVIGPPTYRRWAYASAKALDEFLAMAYWHQCRLPVVITRLFNTVGPRQTGRYGMVLPRFARQALAGEPITVFGDGTQTRCFCHVDDTVRAIRDLLETPDARGAVFNVGSDREVTIAALAEMVRSAAESDSEIRCVPYREAYGEGFEDMVRRVPDLTRVQELIGYRPRYSLEETIQDVIESVRGETD